MAIGYLDVQVRREKVETLKKEMDKAKGPQKFGRYKAWLHFANLEMWQKQGHHFRYLTVVRDGKNLAVCTCGFYWEQAEVVKDSSIKPEIAIKLANLLEDQLQTLKGHRNLDNFASLTCALIVGYSWKEVSKRRLWSAYCQECGEFVIDRSNREARGFVSIHNSACGVGSE